MSVNNYHHMKVDLHEHSKVVPDVDKTLSIDDIKNDLKVSYGNISALYGGEDNLPHSVVQSVKKAEESLKQVKDGQTFNPDIFYPHAIAQQTIKIFTNTLRDENGTGTYKSVEEYMSNVQVGKN